MVSVVTAAAREVAAPEARGSAERVKVAVLEHHGFLFRLLRRLGLGESAAEDAAQQVLCTFARRVGEIEDGKEKAFLFGTAVRVAQSTRRKLGSLRESSDQELLEGIAGAGADELLDDHRARALLDRFLQAMPLDLRTVFVLYELEEMTMAQIAVLLSLPNGTVASRLRRARESFQEMSGRLQAEMARKDGAR